MRSPLRVLQALLRSTLLASLIVAPLARADVGPLRVDLKWTGPVSGAAAVLALALASPYLAPGDCEVCGSDRLDGWARSRLVWGNPRAAGVASDVLANGVIPAAALLNSAFSSRHAGDASAFWDDALVLAEVAALSTDLNGIAKDAVARRRPSATLAGTGSANRSFYSGHTSLAFALATAAGTISTLRGYPSTPWVWAGGMTLATGVAYLRVASDAHWASDVAAGAVLGGLTGFAIPWVFHRIRRSHRGLDLAARPGGVAVVF